MCYWPEDCLWADELTLICKDASIEITVKSLKPSLTFPVKAQSTDTVAHLKSLVAASSSSAPAVEQQRLLLKGKALTDTKLLKEYDIGAGAVVHLVIKPAAASATTSTAAPETAGPSSSSSPAAMEAAADGVIGTIPSHATSSAPKQLSPSRISSSDRTSFRQGGPGHVRLPSLTITTSMDDDSSSPGTEMPLSVIDNAPPLGPQPVISSAEFHRTVSDPAFWQKLHALCVSEFTYEDDADSAWENFLIGMKGRLSAGEAARIRDVVGVRGECKIYRALARPKLY